MLGSGALEPGDRRASRSGTTATINTTHRRYIEVIPLVPPYPAAIPGAYSLEVNVYRGFWMVEWFKREFGGAEVARAELEGVEPEALFDELIATTPPGSMGLILQPYWSPGVRIPGPEAKGAVIGFGDVHTRAHLYRAILEGLAYALREGAERTVKRTKVPIRELRVSGGGSQSPAAVQLIADVFGLPASRPHTHETSGLGAAIDAAVGLGLHPIVRSRGGRDGPGRRDARARPDGPRTYEQLYRGVYLPMYDRLKPAVPEIRRITGYPPRSDAHAARTFGGLTVLLLGPHSQVRTTDCRARTAGLSIDRVHENRTDSLPLPINGTRPPGRRRTRETIAAPGPTRSPLRPPYETGRWSGKAQVPTRRAPGKGTSLMLSRATRMPWRIGQLHAPDAASSRRSQQALLRHERLHELPRSLTSSAASPTARSAATPAASTDPRGPPRAATPSARATGRRPTVATDAASSTSTARPPQRGRRYRRASMTGRTLDRSRLERLMADETAAFERANPRSRELLERAKGSLLDGVPMNWMIRGRARSRYSSTRPTGASSATSTATSTSTSASATRARWPVTARPRRSHAVERQLRRGITHMLPTEDAIVAARRAAPPLRAPVLAVHAHRDRRQPVRDPARPPHHRPAEDPRPQPLLPRLGRRDVRRAPPDGARRRPPRQPRPAGRSRR